MSEAESTHNPLPFDVAVRHGSPLPPFRLGSAVNGGVPFLGADLRQDGSELLNNYGVSVGRARLQVRLRARVETRVALVTVIIVCAL